MYAVICIVSADENSSIGKDHYERATSKDFPTAEAGREYKKTIDKSREPIMIPSYMVEDAIEINNIRLEKESNK